MSNAVTDETANLLNLYAGVPRPATTVPVESLARAYAHFQARHAIRMERDGQHLSKRDRDLISRSLTTAFDAVLQRAWAVQADGALEISGSKSNTYVVRESCAVSDPDTGTAQPCPAQSYARHRHGGECYHTIARELIRLAQVFADRSAPVVELTTEPLATCSVAGPLLHHALAILASAPGQPIDLTIKARRLTMFAGDIHRVHGLALQVPTVGTAKVRLDPEAFAQLWSPFATVADTVDPVDLHLSETGSVTLATPDGTRIATAAGTPVHDPPTPTDGSKT